ncbi:MAG: VCBS repeat-containing protein [Bacteroidetes bacterium]|nr:VCBS repeat-containing protein [Bacteroidota bacterium]
MQRILIFLIVLILFPQIAVLRAQTFTKINAGFEACFYPTAAWADIDNDGDLDVFFSGLDGADNPLAHLYSNDGGGIFTELSSAITGLSSSACAFGDMNNDGLADLAVSGHTGITSMCIIYRNDGGGTFTDISAGLAGFSEGSLAWGDYDNDGLADLLCTGLDDAQNPITLLYHNDGGEIFSDAGASLTGLYESSLAWYDYDLDGDMDFALSGMDDAGLPQSIIYRNDDGIFNDMGAGLTGLSAASVAWGDYNNDTYADLLLSGSDNAGLSHTILYKNNNGNSFSQIAGSYNGISHGSAIWGDFNNDGNLDFIIAGRNSAGGSPNPPPQVLFLEMYVNQGNDQFQVQPLQLPGLAYNAVVCGDYDNDSDLDLLLAGSFENPIGGSNSTAALYRNETAEINIPPASPSGLSYEVIGTDVILQWDAASDDKTPGPGLNYNIRVGSQPDNMDFYSALAGLSDGYRRIVSTGNTGGNTSWSIIGLEFGDYYASVQALDHDYAASSFSPDIIIAVLPTATFSLVDSLCIFEQTTISYTGNASPSAQYIWDFGGGMVLSGTGQGPYVVYWGTEGLKTVTLTVIENNVASVPVSKQVMIVGDAPAPGAISGETELCQGTETSEYVIAPLPGVNTYEWRLNPSEAGAINGNTIVAVVEWNPDFTGNAYVFVRGINACGTGPYSDSLEITLYPLPAQPGKPEGPDQLCLNSPNTNYTTSGAAFANAYQWYLAPESAGAIFGSGLEAEVDWDNTYTGIVEIYVSSFNDCGAGPESDTLIVIINLPPDVDAGEDQVIPFGTSTQLHGSVTGGSGSYSYAWSPPEFLVDHTVPEPFTVDMEQSKQFTLLVIDEVTSCSAQDQVAISVSGGELGLEVYADPEQLCQEEESQLLALAGGGTGVYTYAWTSQPPGFTADIPDPVVSPMETTSYYAEVSDGNGTVSDSIILTVFPLPGDAGPLSGADEVCAGDELILYEIDAVPFATQYYWTLPSGAYGGSDSAAIYVSFTGLAESGEIQVIPVNDCGQGEASLMYIDVKYVTGIPETPYGPDTICTSTDTISTYILDEGVTGAIYYEWRLLPEEAGTILGDGLSASVHWTFNWEGMAAVSVQAVNDCGPSGWATPLPVYAYNSLGLADAETENVYLKLFPNPVKEVLNVEFWMLNDKEGLMLGVWDIYGRKLKDIAIPAGQKQLLLHVPSFPQGLYILILSDQHRVLANEKFVVKK